MKNNTKIISHGDSSDWTWSQANKIYQKQPVATTKNYLAAYYAANNNKLSLKKLSKKSEKSYLHDKKHFLLRRIRKYVENYLEHSTLHGLRYVGDRTISLGERTFWFLAFLLAAIGAAYFISNIYGRYNVNPVIVTMNPNPTPVQEVPFPAVTICNMNIVKKTESEKILANGTAADKSLLDDACDIQEATVSSKDVDEETAKWSNVFKFMSRVSQTCEEMLKVCKWRLKNINCKEIFNPIITDEGLCCNFNQLPLENILRDPGVTNIVSSPEHASNKYQIDDWNPERGYSENASYDVYPFRSPGPGAHLGLTLVLDTEIDNYYCSSSSSVGFKILLHNPAEIPKMTDFAFMLPSGCEVRVVFKPSITDAIPTLQSIDVEKRHCYFTNERYLKYYRTYTKVNCKMECLTNITLRRCGCVPYYLPKTSSTKICGKMQESCSDSVREMMDLKQMAAAEEKQCDCLPACFQLDFEKSMSYGKLTDAFQISKEIIGNISVKYFMKNMIVVHIYFVNTQFSKFTKSELYGFSEFLSNTGGLLGLFLGFSALSVVEIVYHFTLRALCNCVRNRKHHEQKNVLLVK